MENKIQKINKENNSLASTNYESLRNELSKILENQRISKEKTRSNIGNYLKRVYWISIAK